MLSSLTLINVYRLVQSGFDNFQGVDFVELNHFLRY